MIRALIVAGLALVPMAPLTAFAQDRLRTETRYDPAPLWYYGPGKAFGAGHGRMRIVSAGGVSAALTLNQYWAYEGIYRASLGRLANRMSVPRADGLARKEAIEAILARYPDRRAAAFRASPIGGSRPAPIRPGS